MKKVLALLIFSVLLFNSTVFAQKARITNTKPVLLTDTVLQSETVLPGELVVYNSSKAFFDGRGVWLEWETASEIKNLGFYLYRQTEKSMEQVGDGIIGGGYLRAGEEKFSGDKYTYFDRGGDGTAIYYIESYSIDGQRQLSSPIYPKYVNDLREVAGNSSKLLDETPKKPQTLTRSDLNFSKELQSEINANSLPPNIIKQREIAGKPGVKIGVKKDGIYNVSKASLEAAGFDVNSSPALWQLYLNGVEQSIIVGNNGDYIEFYGKGIETLESNTQIYFLTVGAPGENGRRMDTRFIRPLAGIGDALSFSQTFTQKHRKSYVSDILNGEAENFFDNRPITSAGTPPPGNINAITFNLPSVDFNVGTSIFTVGVQGLTFGPHQVRVVLNNQEIGIINGDERELMTKNFTVPTNVFVEGTNTLQLFSMAGPGDVNFLESVKVHYSRQYAAKNNQLSYYTSRFRASSVTGFTSPNIRVFDLSYPDSPQLVTSLAITQNGSDFSVRIPSNRSAVMFALENSAISTVDSIVQNVPAALTTPAHNAQFLVISHKNFINEANVWANYRLGQGLSTEIVDIEDIYDEFSYGVQSTNGIRNFLQYAKNNWQTPPQYILVLGDAHYDYKNYEGPANHNYVPTKMVDTVYMETGSDEALADFNDDGLAEISIGRIPAREAATITQAFNKMTAFELIVGQWLTRGAYFVSDMPIGYDFDALSHRIREQLPANMQVLFRTRIDCINPPPPVGQTTQQCLDQQHNALLAEVNTGRYLVNYSGHGSTGFWAVNSPNGTPQVLFFNTNDALGLANNTSYSLFTMLTCLNGYFMGGNDSLAEALMKAPNGGASASWTSTGKTTPDVQEIMATRFFGQLTAGNMPRIGDLILDSKTVLVGGRDVRLSWSLIGDPAMKVR